jgi:hypothetical protein
MTQPKRGAVFALITAENSAPTRKLSAPSRFLMSRRGSILQYSRSIKKIEKDVSEYVAPNGLMGGAEVELST